MKAADKLTHVAGELFYRRGIRAVGVDEIVNETGVTKPTLYRNFASKDDLVTMCLRKQVEDSVAALDAITALHPGDPLAQLRGLIQHHANAMARPDYRGCAVTNAAVEFPERDHPARIVIEACKAGLRARIGTLAREIGCSDPDTLADGLLLLLEGAMATRHTAGSQGPSAALVHTADALIQAYRT
jgi:AcrR family transcriptional regulator